MYDNAVLICEDSIEGILTAVYDSYLSPYREHENIIIVTADEYTNALFSDEYDIISDYDKALKVIDKMKRIDEYVYSMVYRALLSYEDGKANAVYNFIKLALKMGKSVTEHLSDDNVNKVYSCVRNINYEQDNYLGFVRFTELDRGVLFSKIEPKNNILPLIMAHFEDRLPMENFIIYDEGRQIAIVHQRGCESFLTDAEDINLDVINNISRDEACFRELWQTFFDSIAIRERTNYNLQRQHLKIRFRKNMTETFTKK